MTDHEMRIAIAEACGFIPGSFGGQPGYFYGYTEPGGRETPVPDYLTDLNAMHEAAVKAGPRVIKAMRFWLYELTDQMTAHEATARQRAEAFLRTIGKWVE